MYVVPWRFLGKAMESESGFSNHKGLRRSSRQEKKSLKRRLQEDEEEEQNDQEGQEQEQMEVIKHVGNLLQRSGCSAEDLRLIRMEMREEAMGHADEILEGFLWLGKSIVALAIVNIYGVLPHSHAAQGA